MTIAEELRAEGREEGIARAIDVILKIKEKFEDEAAFDLAAEIRDKNFVELDRIENTIDDAENIGQLRKKIK